ncbi:hypothetical protein [Aggregatibacter actinomycetemcomitans]|uniref:hypothetical protein n=2 Tax=Aggregatibacter actinomycetemcomitans TaxID=714 RepID=UPI001F11AEBE|nr:hypothetical protein [Aggregatibacter actinomycetemcomitans]
MKYLSIITFPCLFSSCLPIEPIMGGGIVYNFCDYPIEWRSDNIPEHHYQNNTHKKIIAPNETKYMTFVVQDNLTEKQKENEKKQYFVKDEGEIKKRFYIDRYSQSRVNFIACPENAKPTGDGNWIKAN